jgi:hypothetical protein
MSPPKGSKGGDMIDYQLAVALFDYCPETGALTWRVSTNSFKKGVEAGTVSRKEGCSSYKTIRVFGEPYKAHRVIWLIQTGKWPEKYIDHIDGNGLNNKWSNLREATPSQNSMNQKVRSDCASGIKGVSYDNRRNLWYAYIDVDGKRKHLGRHETLDEATAARMAAQSKFHGEFAREV